MSSGMPFQPVYVDSQTAQMIAGTAVMLLDRLCPDQPKGSRILQGDDRYTIVENGRNLDIQFRGDKTREATTVLAVRTYPQPDGKPPLAQITTNLSSEDIVSFTRINQLLNQDIQRARSMQSHPGKRQAKPGSEMER